MSFQQLKQTVFDINIALQKSGLVVLTWGNASGIDRAADNGRGVLAIKPSGVPYDKLTADDIVVLSLATGEVIEGKARPSSDTPTHLLLAQKFPSIGGIVHTHSLNATIFAQAHRDLPCLGTTHADHFYGTIPATREMHHHEIAGDYELETGKVIIETFEKRGISPEDVPAVLIASHGPFVWGTTPKKALENAIALEAVATMQLGVYQLNAAIKTMQQPLLDRHFKRKHGPGATYGQPGK